MTLSILFQLLGIIGLSLSLDKHFTCILNRPLSPAIKGSLLVSGVVSLIISIMIAILYSTTPSIAMVHWFAILSILILLVSIIYATLIK